MFLGDQTCSDNANVQQEILAKDVAESSGILEKVVQAGAVCHQAKFDLSLIPRDRPKHSCT